MRERMNQKHREKDKYCNEYENIPTGPHGIGITGESILSVGGALIGSKTCTTEQCTEQTECLNNDDLTGMARSIPTDGHIEDPTEEIDFLFPRMLEWHPAGYVLLMLFSFVSVTIPWSFAYFCCGDPITLEDRRKEAADCCRRMNPFQKKNSSSGGNSPSDGSENNESEMVETTFTNLSWCENLQTNRCCQWGTYILAILWTGAALFVGGAMCCKGDELFNNHD